MGSLGIPYLPAIPVQAVYFSLSCPPDPPSASSPSFPFPQSTQGQALPSHVMEQLAGPVVLPSHYLREAVAGFAENLAQYKACCAELEQVLLNQPHDAGARGQDGSI